jgi:hypothetical protein
MRVKMARLRAARKNRTHRENWFSRRTPSPRAWKRHRRLAWNALIEVGVKGGEGIGTNFYQLSGNCSDNRGQRRRHEEDGREQERAAGGESAQRGGFPERFSGTSEG